MSKRIGIFSGSFDPVHKGHVAFALASITAARLDMVYFAPETKPRRKPPVSHIAHRMAMLELAVRAHPPLATLDLPGKYFLPKSTMAHLKKRFPDDTLVLLLGADLYMHLVEYSGQWPHVEYLLQQMEFAVAERDDISNEAIVAGAAMLPVQPIALHVIPKVHTQISSSTIRDVLREGGHSAGLLPSVERYAKKHWLYHDVQSATKHV